MSDNGGLAAESYWRDGKLHTQNHPLNSGKGSTYEGGIREPMIVTWPGVVAPGSKCNDYLLIEDFYPTILEMAGIKKYKTVQPIDGIRLHAFTETDRESFQRTQPLLEYAQQLGKRRSGNQL